MALVIFPLGRMVGTQYRYHRTMTENQEPLPQAPAERTQRNVESSRTLIAEWASLAAIAISALALALGIYQTRLMQTQARASVWPYLALGFRYNADGFSLYVRNNGVGPAAVRSVHVSIDDRPARHWSDVLQPILPQVDSIEMQVSALKGVVIPPSLNRETDVDAMSLKAGAVADAMFKAANRLKIDVCYCSIYDECWIAHLRKPEPERTAQCRSGSDDFDY
jgi:hypothetical protein